MEVERCFAKLVCRVDGNCRVDDLLCGNCLFFSIKVHFLINFIIFNRIFVALDY